MSLIENASPLRAACCATRYGLRHDVVTQRTQGPTAVVHVAHIGTQTFSTAANCDMPLIAEVRSNPGSSDRHEPTQMGTGRCG